MPSELSILCATKAMHHCAHAADKVGPRYLQNDKVSARSGTRAFALRGRLKEAAQPGRAFVVPISAALKLHTPVFHPRRNLLLKGRICFFALFVS